MPKHAKTTRNVEKDLWPYLVGKTESSGKEKENSESRDRNRR